MLDPWLVKFIVVTVVIAWFVTTVASMILPDFEVPASLTGAFVALAGGAIAQSKKPEDPPPAPPTEEIDPGPTPGKKGGKR